MSFKALCIGTNDGKPVLFGNTKMNIDGKAVSDLGADQFI